MTTLDDTRHCPMCEDAAKKIRELESDRARIAENLIQALKRERELEQRVKVLTEALTRIRDEDIGPAKCVSIAYKALAPLPNESDSPETAIEEAPRRQ